MGDLTNNLSRHEFACKCGCGFDTIDWKTVEVIQDVCDHFQCAVTINSGCRCAVYNEEVGGSENSQHKLGRAGDCVYHGVPPDVVREYLYNKYPNSLGIGAYETFTHIDSRDGMARW